MWVVSETLLWLAPSIFGESAGARRRLPCLLRLCHCVILALCLYVRHSRKGLIMTTATNSDIYRYALKGKEAQTRTRAMRTIPQPNSFDIPRGWLTERMYENLVTLALSKRLDQVIFSYSTVVAFKLSGEWLLIDDNHSPTTGRHISTLWNLNARRVPHDASLEELERVAAGLMRYTGTGYRAAS